MFEQEHTRCRGERLQPRDHRGCFQRLIFWSQEYLAECKLTCPRQLEENRRKCQPSCEDSSTSEIVSGEDTAPAIQTKQLKLAYVIYSKVLKFISEYGNLTRFYTCIVKTQHRFRK